MQFEKNVTMLLSNDVAAARDFYRTHLEMAVAFDIGWFVSMQKDVAGGAFELSICAADHDSIPLALRAAASGVVLTFLVQDADAQYRRLKREGVSILTEVVDEPWGQRHFFAEAPDGVGLDIYQHITPDPEWMRENGFG